MRVVDSPPIDCPTHAQWRDQHSPSMVIHQIDPTQDPRWCRFVERHPRASVFHMVEWLKALQRTYGYQPVVLTTSPPTGELKNGLVFCRVESWLTGRRLVSLPFSDHCEPLCDSVEDLEFLIRYLQTVVERHHWKYLEIRPVSGDIGKLYQRRKFSPIARYFLHNLSLCPDLDDLFASFDKDCIQRRIRRAEKAGLSERCGTSEKLMRDFYALFVITRRRHDLPPMPYVWFQNLRGFLGKSMEVRVAYKADDPIAAILTLQFRDTVHYKYGCSDVHFKQLGATPWLLWKAISAAKSSGASRFELGRTADDNPGLLQFKNHWVCHPEELVYWEFPGALAVGSERDRKLRAAKRVFSLMPQSLLSLAGRLLYRHIG